MGGTFGSAIGEIWPLWKPQELERLAAIERAIAKGAALGDDERRAAQAESHRLAGTLAALGHGAAANAARELERRFLVADLHEIEPLSRSVRAALEAPPLGSAP